MRVQAKYNTRTVFCPRKDNSNNSNSSTNSNNRTEGIRDPTTLEGREKT
jgi:hypothetical protein